MSEPKPSKSEKRKAKDAEIMAVMDRLDEEYPDKSDAWIFSMTADMASVDYGRVVDAWTRSPGVVRVK